eukprot:scaffold1156_cov394-Prasinococcus_capsulatus_cf.AAC.5
MSCGSSSSSSVAAAAAAAAPRAGAPRVGHWQRRCHRPHGPAAGGRQLHRPGGARASARAEGLQEGREPALAASERAGWLAPTCPEACLLRLSCRGDEAFVGLVRNAAQKGLDCSHCVVSAVALP